MAPSDDELLQLARQRDERAFDELMGRHMAAVVRLARRVLGDESDAADVAQDVFLAAYLKLLAWPEGVFFRDWVLWTTLSKATKRARQRASSVRLAKVSARLRRADAGPAASQADDRMAEVHRAMQRLSERQRAVVSLHFLDGLPIAETARILKTTANNVRVTLFKAIEHLRQVIKK